MNPTKSRYSKKFHINCLKNISRNKVFVCAMAGTSLLDSIFRRRKKKTTEFISDNAVFEFDFDTIRAATNEFSDLVGSGGFSSVFKGRLQSGKEIAVKRLSENSNGTKRFFHNELNLMSKLKHKNLINLVGFCTKRDQYYLVYEFMPNSSLDRFIFDSHRASELNWEMCRNIVEGIARGLRYLHEESGLWVVHRDINPTNILLDSDLKPKISGFGLAKIMQQGENEAETTIIAGTVGYLDPEYYYSGRVSIKSDVYAFGVTILAIISRRKALRVGEDPQLIEYVMGLWNRGEVINVIHEVMRGEESEESISEILRYIHIALLCIDVNAERRPSLDKVLHWFSCFSTPLPELAIDNQFHAEEETNIFHAEDETTRSLSPSLSPGHSSVMSPVS